MDVRSFLFIKEQGGAQMFGRFGMLIVLVAVFACTGLWKGTKVLVPMMNKYTVLGVGIMVAAIVLSALSGKIAGKFREDMHDRAGAITRLSALVLCGIGAIVVFCG